REPTPFRVVGAGGLPKTRAVTTSSPPSSCCERRNSWKRRCCSTRAIWNSRKRQGCATRSSGCERRAWDCRTGWQGELGKASCRVVPLQVSCAPVPGRGGFERAISSGVERRVDIVEVGGSRPPAPTSEEHLPMWGHDPHN